MESSDDELDEDTEDEADAEYEAVVAEDAAAEDDDASTIPTELKKWMVKIEAEQAKHAEQAVSRAGLESLRIYRRE